MVVGENGVLNRAQEVSIATNEDKEKEKISFAINSSKMETLGNLNEDILRSELETEFGSGKSTLEKTESGTYVVKINDSNKTYYINSNGDISVKPYLVDSVQIGDYVDYNEGDKDSYTSSADLNGVEDQTFSTNNSIRWQVLEKKDGKIYLVSSDVIKSDNNTEYSLNGKVAYLNGVNELNKICSIYGNGVGAESSRSLNCDDFIELICDMSSYSEKEGYFDLDLCPDGFPDTYDFFDSNGISATKILANYRYYGLTYWVMNKSSKCYEILFLTNKEIIKDKEMYWLATQSFNGNTGGAWYGIWNTIFGETENDYKLSAWHTYCADRSSVTRTAGIRPIVILNLNLQDNGKNESGEWRIEK